MVIASLQNNGSCFILKSKTLQGRRRLLKSGPAMNVERRSRVPKARVGGEHERRRFPRENFIFSDVRRNDSNAL